ncbi:MULTISPECIES: hypothetical protein [Acidobacteriaceae]|uniref:hypothetical protein n=1 Tax=Acidobacteriaceae TaxID=204434 RepID=UPI00131C3DF3|nr:MULTISPECIES: hypothetical protein [Acidobacteriaceae]MDW5264738.1 hypothetical protein [Edaphobacter sp.]
MFYRIFLRSLAALMLTTLSYAQTITGPASWTTSDVSFRPINITSTKSSFWICGVGEGIATSVDGKHWEVKHHIENGGAVLLGIGFASETFGYAFGTSGALLITEDGGTTWLRRNVSDQTILQASLADSSHGIFRTGSALLYLDGSDIPHAITEPSEVLRKFPYTYSLVTLSSEKMGILLSEGPFSEAGFLTTANGGKNWTFYDPPSTGIASFLAVDGHYWMSGFKVVDKDKPGGGHSVPVALTSENGTDWQTASHEVQACHWQECGLCTTTGCFASNSLLINFFHSPTTYFSIPPGPLTAKWASVRDQICTIHSGVTCNTLAIATDVLAVGDPKPAEQVVKPLSAKISSNSSLQCLACGLDPVYVDTKAQGSFVVHVSLLIRSDGTVESAEVKGAPSESLQHKIQAQMFEWLFEPPTQNGKPIRISTQSTISINVVRSK